MKSPQELLTWIESIPHPHAPLAERHLWMIDVLNWIRGTEQDAQRSAKRVQLALDVIGARPEWQQQWRTLLWHWWHEMDVTPLLSDGGFASRASFLGALAGRLRRHLLPSSPETTDLNEFFTHLFANRSDADWLRALDDRTTEALIDLFTLQAPPPPTPHPPEAPQQDHPFEVIHHPDPHLRPLQQVLLDAMDVGISQIVATGLASDIRQRIDPAWRQKRVFEELPACAWRLRKATLQRHTHEAAPSNQYKQAQLLQNQLQQCTEAAQSVTPYLAQHGISVDIVYRLHQIQARIQRTTALIEALISFETHDQNLIPSQGMIELIAHLVEATHDAQSVRQLFNDSTQLTAQRVIERSAETGEHYITRTQSEYRQMLWQAGCGGAVIGLTTWAKFSISHFTQAWHLSPFLEGLCLGLNYAAFFLLIWAMHWTVATKQPAFTAPALAAHLSGREVDGSMKPFVEEVAHLLRSQFAAILGNVGCVIPSVVLLCLIATHALNQPFLDETKAQQVIHELSAIGPSPLYAAVTGCLLFLSSLLAGWAENGFVFFKMRSALALHPRWNRWLGAERCQRWAAWLEQHTAALVANASLGLLLGLVPMFANFFVSWLEVRHVTLSAGQLTAAAMTLGSSVLTQLDFWLAVVGVGVIGVLNLGVSFYLAMRLALKGQKISEARRQDIRLALREQWRNKARSFFLPPSDAISPPPPPPPTPTIQSTQ